MKSTAIMVIAGEPSGDALGAELVQALRAEAAFHCHPAKPVLRFFGAGGLKLEAEGMELAVDLTRHAVIGLWEVIKNYGKFRRVFNDLLDLAEERRPALLMCVDFSGFNRRFATALRKRAARSGGKWNPRIVQYVSPQVWASRPGRVRKMTGAYDLLLTIFPFEKAWYAERAPALKVEFVGHPMLDRFRKYTFEPLQYPLPTWAKARNPAAPLVVLLPGSRKSEIQRHLPVLLEALKQIQRRYEGGVNYRIVLPRELSAGALLKWYGGMLPPNTFFQSGGLAEALREATIAIASTGTVTMECAYFRVPTIALYKTSWSTYQIGKRIVTVKYLAMPNILADEAVFPEYVQDAATGTNLAEAALDLLQNEGRRKEIQAKLETVVAGLGSTGANVRAAKAIWELLDPTPGP
ncbi:MAG: lipid-A-disaccharide synthase [Proteobacteria bacterium]|nr:lipid-A-disaccharide synthase [Pseudomonadota bacterium]